MVVEVVPSLRNPSGASRAFRRLGRAVRRARPAAVAMLVFLAGAPAPAQEIDTGAVGAPKPVEPPKIDLEKVAKPRPDPVPPPKKDPLSSLGKLERVSPAPAPSTNGGTGTPPAPVSEEEASKNASIGASFVTQTEARTFTLSVPAPRGQILDRKGYPLAQNRVAHYAAINFPLLEGADDTTILRYAGERIVQVNRLLGKRWDLSADVVLTHYKNRRWLPLTFSDSLTDEEEKKVRANPMKGLMLHPVYLRHYPQGSLLAHVIGYVGKRPPRELGPIRPNEPLWGEGMGVEGLEETYETYLTGEPGRVTLLFEADGTKLREEMVRRPRPGNNLITSIDSEMQRIAEEVLARKVKRGAFVVMDVRSGDILVMASFPTFNPNDFIPSISQEAYAKLANDPEKPLYSRAFRGAYPPASTFKVAVALAALEERVISENSVYDCPTSWSIGDVVMRNWNKDPEGSMNVIGALARSCNTWFYQVGTQAGADPVTMMARRLGLGEKTGLPLKAEIEGLVPTNRWWRDKYGYNMSTGDLANICIGQGQVEASPLQIARMMAAIGNGQYVVKPRLIRQIQDYNNGVIQSVPQEEHSRITVDPYYLNVVRRGMDEVVNSGRGTGRAAGHEKMEVAGKTGTGQWKPAYQQNIGWFAGFAPADYPVWSFAVVYEGDPGEVVGGGKNAAPVVGEFLKEYLTEEHLAEVEQASDAVKLALADVEPARAPSEAAGGSIFRDASVADQYQQGADQLAPEPSNGTAVAEQESGISRWLRRFRRR